MDIFAEHAVADVRQLRAGNAVLLHCVDEPGPDLRVVNRFHGGSGFLHGSRLRGTGAGHSHQGYGDGQDHAA